MGNRGSETEGRQFKSGSRNWYCDQIEDAIRRAHQDARLTGVSDTADLDYDPKSFVLVAASHPQSPSGHLEAALAPILNVVPAPLNVFVLARLESWEEKRTEHLGAPWGAMQGASHRHRVAGAALRPQERPSEGLTGCQRISLPPAFPVGE